MSSYYVDLDNDLGDELDVWRESREERRRTKKKPRAAKGSHHWPATDAEAKALIEELGHDEWETRKVRGSFSSAPYTLHATVNGRAHTIHLPGRFGTTLTWLKHRVDVKEKTK